MADLDALLAVQERDLALDRLHHRRRTLAERDAVAALHADVVDLETVLGAVRSERDRIASEERRLEDEVRTLEEHATAQEQRLYSGEVVAPRELQALQADVEQVRKHQRSVEDRQLSAMEQREPLEVRIAEDEAKLAVLTAGLAKAQGALSEAEQSIDAELATETAAHDELAAGIEAGLLGEYERCRAKAKGVGVARLVGTTCQGCHLAIPATEAEHIKKAPVGTVSHCDNCGCILVP